MTCTRIKLGKTRGFICYTSYSKAIDDAVARTKRGERQLYCGTCGHWVWPDECDHNGRLTQKQFNSEANRTAKLVRERYPTERDRYPRELKEAKKRGEI